MKTRTPNLAYILFSLLFLLINGITSAQVGIGTTSPNSDALLDVDASTTSGGILLPRLALSNTNSPSPLSADVAGMIVYNTATAGDVNPGFYFNDGSDWIRIYEGDDWKTTGNAGTTPGTNYIGTSDSQNLIFKTNDTENMRILTDGRVAINNNAPSAGDLLTVTGNSGDFVVNGYGSGGGVGVYGEDSGGGIGVYGNTGSSGYGVYGANSSSGRGVYGANNSTGQGVRGYNSGTGYGIFAKSANSSGIALGIQNSTSSGSAIVSAGNNGSLYNLPGSGGTFNGTIGIAGLTTSASGTGVAGVGNTGTTTYNLSTGSGVSGTGSTTGVYGVAINTSGTRQGGYFTMNKSGLVNESPPATDDPIALLAGYNGTDYYGGYFDGNQDNNSGGGGGNSGEDYAYVGIRSGGTTYKILGTGSNSTMVDDAEGNKRVFFSPEAPEVLFEDYGVGKLVDGTATIEIDPLFSSVIHVSDDHPLKVFIQLEGNCNGVYVSNKSDKGFTVIELNQGTSNVPFSWHIVANREDTMLSDGRIFSKHVGVRFPIGPKKLRPTDINSNKTKTAKKTSNENNSLTNQLTKNL